MQISKIKPSLNFNAMDKNEVQPKSSKNNTQKTYSQNGILGLSLVALGVLGTAAYFIITKKTPKSVLPENYPSELGKIETLTEKYNKMRPKIKPYVEIPEDIHLIKNSTTKANTKNKLNIIDKTPIEISEKINNEINLALQNFEPYFETTTQKIITPLENGLTKVEYFGVKADGEAVKDVLVFDKNNKITRRFTQEILSDTKDKIINIYKGGEEILKTPESFADGIFDKKFFIKQIITSPENLEKASDYPIGYIKITKIIRPDKTYTKFSNLKYLDYKLKGINIENGTVGQPPNITSTKKYIFGYDLNKNSVGYAVNNGQKINVKFYDKTKKQVEFSSFEELFNTIPQAEFRRL